MSHYPANDCFFFNHTHYQATFVNNMKYHAKKFFLEFLISFEKMCSRVIFFSGLSPIPSARLTGRSTVNRRIGSSPSVTAQPYQPCVRPSSPHRMRRRGSGRTVNQDPEKAIPTVWKGGEGRGPRDPRRMTREIPSDEGWRWSWRRGGGAFRKWGDFLVGGG